MLGVFDVRKMGMQYQSLKSAGHKKILLRAIVTFVPATPDKFRGT